MVQPEVRINQFMDTVQLIIPRRRSVPDVSVVFVETYAEIVQECPIRAHPGNIAGMFPRISLPAALKKEPRWMMSG